MKRIFTLLTVALWVAGTVRAQVASTECIVEAKAVFSLLDHNILITRDQPVRIHYEHRYIMRSDPQQEKVGGEESRVYARNFMHHHSNDFEECTDASEAFNHRKFQFVVYRTKSTLGKAGIIPNFDRGIFDHCTVRTCEFIPAPGRDSTSFKQALLILDEAGRKKYQITDMQLVWEPVQGEIISATINFTERSRTVWASYRILEFNPEYQPETSTLSAAGVFLNGSGLADKYQGSELKDYR